jgi:hypothetical protein
LGKSSPPSSNLYKNFPKDFITCLIFNGRDFSLRNPDSKCNNFMYVNSHILATAVKALLTVTHQILQIEKKEEEKRRKHH